MSGVGNVTNVCSWRRAVILPGGGGDPSGKVVCSGQLANVVDGLDEDLDMIGIVTAPTHGNYAIPAQPVSEVERGFKRLIDA